jgi:hypothetical protein
MIVAVRFLSVAGYSVLGSFVLKTSDFQLKRSSCSTRKLVKENECPLGRENLTPVFEATKRRVE